MAKLEVEIGADNSEFKSKIKEVEFDIKELSKVKLEQIKLGLDTKQIDSQIKDAKMSLKTLQTTLKDTGTSFTKLDKPVQNGGNTLMQFSRIAQDAPFGIMGIGNNITATAESFGHLAASSGGAGNALKAVASSMLGTGGILLAVSLVTTALTIMSQNGLTIGDVFDKLTGNFNEFGSSLKKASEEATKSAIEEMGALKGLAAVAQSDTVSRQERMQAVKDLQSQYPAYFGNLSNEEIMYGNLTGAINEVTKALISKGISEKLTKDAVEPTLNLWKANGKLNQAKADQIKLEKNLSDETAKRVAAGIGGRTGKEVGLTNAISNNKLAISSSRDNIKELTAVVGSFERNIAQANKASAGLLIKPPKAPKKAAAPAARESVVAVGSLLKPIDNEKIKKDGEKVIKLLGESVGNAVQIFKSTPIPVNIPLVPILSTNPLTEVEQALLAFNDAANEIIMGSITDTFGNLGSAIGNALVSGGNVLSAIGQSILQGLSSFLSDMGGELIKYGTLAVIKGKLDIAILTGGAASVVAGVAAIGVGIALKAAGAAIGSASKGGAGGGGGSRGVSTGASVSSPTASTNNNTGGGFQNVVFEISGQSLIGVLSSSLDRNNRLGGGLKLTA
jgi:hypothetical protein